jgi:hypothetical protein
MAIFVAVNPFYYQPKGQAGVYVRRGETVEEGHPLLAANPHAFTEQVVTYPVPQKKAASAAKSKLV